MSTPKQRIDDSIGKLETNADLIEKVVTGPVGTTVNLGDNTVDTVAEAVSKITDSALYAHTDLSNLVADGLAKLLNFSNRNYSGAGGTGANNNGAVNLLKADGTPYSSTDQRANGNGTDTQFVLIMATLSTSTSLGNGGVLYSAYSSNGSLIWGAINKITGISSGNHSGPVIVDNGGDLAITNHHTAQSREYTALVLSLDLAS